MILRLIRWWLRRKGLKAVSWGAHTWEVPHLVWEMEKDARLLVRNEDAKPQGGEFKRHQVYSRMLKLYPTVAKENKDDISLAIELAVRRTKGKL